MNETERFGFSQAYLEKVLQEHNSGRVIRSGCYIPTEEEVRALDAKELTDILIDWLWESPSELVPNNEQIQEVRKILLSRPDQSAINLAIIECNEYLKKLSLNRQN